MHPAKAVGGDVWQISPEVATPLLSDYMRSVCMLQETSVSITGVMLADLPSSGNANLHFASSVLLNYMVRVQGTALALYLFFFKMLAIVVERLFSVTPSLC